ncbi:TIR domain-containing protein [Thiocystis minor]|uniref:toll/interleukin-1 receptor domain-containing protein n=1 Tax=Thiocystis minor TaxID=61597 RepID=UPI0019138C6D|nr:TIR domain-containing protein [Thiocystis minor]MBK5965654.1 TIR domain-containing protein [Thiocystis minor]
MTKYHVAFSFAGEDRDYVERVANLLRSEEVDVFYDNFEEADLWGKNLYTHLSDVYQNKALFTVIFISEAYKKKLWTNHERESAQARAFSESREYILPAFFDESVEVPGLLRTTGYVSLKNKTPEELASLIIQKLEKSGVTRSQKISYSDVVKADVDYPLSNGQPVSEIVRDLRIYTWSVQNPAINRLLGLDWSKISTDEAFILGRNLYQTACGNERKAAAVLDDLRRELAAIPEDRALDLLNGMFFEVYFNSAGEFRGRELKNRCLSKLLALQTVTKFAASIAFIRRALEPYRKSILFMPSIDPAIVEVDLSISKADPSTLRTLKVNDRDLLTTNSDDENLDPHLWRLSLQNFTLSKLRQLLSNSWGLPPGQLQIKCLLDIDVMAKIRLPPGASIVRPVE